MKAMTAEDEADLISRVNREIRTFEWFDRFKSLIFGAAALVIVIVLTSLIS